MKILVDADACPVKEETYRTAGRHRLSVQVVANSWFRTPDAPFIELFVVDGSFDAADDWIVEHTAEKDIVITSDIPLAARCLEKGAAVLHPTGSEFTAENIGGALATRELMSDLRGSGTLTGGPPPYTPQDRSRFLNRLDALIHRIRRTS